MDTTLDNSFAFLAPEIVFDVIDQIAGKNRFTADHLNLSRLAGTFGDFFRGAGSVFYVGTHYCGLEKHMCTNGVVEKRFVESISQTDPQITEKTTEDMTFYLEVGTEAIYPIDQTYDLLCRIAHRYYGRILDLRLVYGFVWRMSEDDAMRRVKRLLDGFQPRFEGMRFMFCKTGGQTPQLFVDFVARMLQSNYMRCFIVEGWAPLTWNLEHALIPFCRSDQFELFLSHHLTRYSADFVSAAYEALRSKNCVFDLKPRVGNVHVTDTTAERMAQKYEMTPIEDDLVLNYPQMTEKFTLMKEDFHIKYWKQEQNSTMPEMSVELILAARFDFANWSFENRWDWRAIICLQKCDNKSLAEAYSDGGPKKQLLFFDYLGLEHGVELPAEVTIKTE